MAANHRLINQTSGAVEYYTPPVIIQAAWNTMGGIDLDPASSEAANLFVQARQIYTVAEDGLAQPWFGRVWLNHPFGRAWNARWIDKLVSEFETDRVEQACCITYASTSKQWLQPLLVYPMCFLVPRTNYLLPDGTLKRGVTRGSVVTYLGVDVRRFKEAFAHLGVVKVSS